MKLARLIPLWLFLIAACGEGGGEGPFGICSHGTEEEQATVWQVHDAFSGWVMSCTVAWYSYGLRIKKYWKTQLG